MERPPRVFVSYSHEGEEHAAAVLALANRLRADGVDARIDRYEAAPAQGWPRWMVEQLDEADFVVCVCTATYRERFEGRVALGKGRGVNWEGFLARQMLYDDKARSAKLIPVLPRAGSEEHVPRVLRAFARYALAGGYADLLDRLHGRGGVPTPPVGTPPVPLAGRQDARGATAEKVETRDAWRLLETLLGDLYRVDEARGWVRYLDQDLHRWLPEGAVEPAAYFTRLVEGLERRGLVSRGFFAERATERERRRGRIDALRDLFVGAGIIEDEVLVAPQSSPPLATRATLLWAPPREAQPSTVRHVDLPPTRIHLDRVAQWHDLRIRSGRPTHQVFLFHAPAEQALRWFTERVVRYLNDEDHLHGVAPGAEIRLISTAPTQGGLAARCVTPAAWGNRFVERLSPLGGTLPQLLAENSRAAPLMLVLGPHPFREGAGGTPREVYDAFLSFLETLYTPALPARGTSRPVHLLVPVHGPRDGGFVTGILDVLLRGQEARVWGFNEDVASVRYPSQGELREYVGEYLGLQVGDDDWWRRVMQAHDLHKPHYEQLCEALDELLAEVWPTP